MIRKRGKKHSVDLPADVVEEIRSEAKRQDRSFSWIAQQAIRIAMPRLRELPGWRNLQ